MNNLLNFKEKTILAFDIETIPDISGIQRLHDLPSTLSDQEILEFMLKKRRTEKGNEFMPHHLHQVVAISCCMRWEEKIYVNSIGTEEDSEDKIINGFFNIINQYEPQLVSWNGGGFDLPVLHYRSLIHGISAPSYWNLGEEKTRFKWNNYISRYHLRHCDLMDILALYQARANVPLDELAKLCGFPGKLGMDGSQVWSAYQNDQLVEIRKYCETDAMNTYLLFLKFQLFRGKIDPLDYNFEKELLMDYLKNSEEEHFIAFMNAFSAC